MLTNNLSISNYRFTFYKEMARSGRFELPTPELVVSALSS